MFKSLQKVFQSNCNQRTIVTNKKYQFNDPNFSKVAMIGLGYSGLQVVGHLPELTSTIANYHVKAFDYKTQCFYTPGYDYMPYFLKTQEEIERPTLQVLNTRTNVSFNEVMTVDPEKNTIITTDHREYTYDYLILTAGLEPKYRAIKGFGEALSDPDCPVVSAFDVQSALKARREFEFITSGNILFYNHSKSKVFHSGLNNAILLEQNIRRQKGQAFREMTNISYLTNTKTVFPHIKHSIRIQDILNEKGIEHDDNYNLELVEINKDNREAIFFNTQTEETIVKPFDVLFVNPEFEVPHFLKGLCDNEGYLNINSNLVHNDHKNILSCGHIARFNNSFMSPHSITKQSTIMATNFERMLQAESVGKEIDESQLVKFLQDTIIPIHAGDKKIMNIDLNPASIDIYSDPSSISYYKDLYVNPGLYFKLTTQGAWFGETGFRAPKY